MRYICADCGHKGKTAAKGLCPACMSTNFRREQMETEKTEQKKSSLKSKLSLVAVWLVFAYAIYDLIVNK